MSTKRGCLHSMYAVYIYKKVEAAKRESCKNSQQTLSNDMSDINIYFCYRFFTFEYKNW